MPPRPDQNAAETGHRHFCERQEQSGEAGLNRRMGREYSGSGTSTGGEIRWHGSKTGRRFGRRQANLGMFPAFRCQKRAKTGSVFLNLCRLYWGCRFAGYGNKWPSQ
jgi:hypothetical protein